MIEKNKLGFPKSSFLILLICGGLLLILFLLIILPAYVSNSKKSVAIREINNEIEARKANALVYSDLQKALVSKELVLPNPPKITISRDEAAKFQNVFRTMAEESGLRTISLTPDVNMVGGSPKFLSNQAVLKGELVNFRQMLIKLAAVPYMDRIDEISITQQPDAMEFRMKIWLALNG